MTAKRLDGKALAQQLRAKMAEEIATLSKPPGLAVVLVGDNPASASYVRNKQKACAEVGIISTLHHLPTTTTQSELIELLDQLNTDDTIHGILVQLPLPSQIDETAMIEAVGPTKDVDCFHPENLGKLLAGVPKFYPCTPYGVIELLRRNDVELSGANVLVVGRSNIVGKPLALMLMQKRTATNPAGCDATVTVAHSRSRSLTTLCQRADVIVAATGQIGLITPEMVHSQSIIVDVGTNMNDAGKLVGDVDPQVREVAAALSPVPGGVGPMTITMLLANTLRACCS